MNCLEMEAVLPGLHTAVEVTTHSLANEGRHNILVSGRSGTLTAELLRSHWNGGEITITNWGIRGNETLYKGNYLPSAPQDWGDRIRELLLRDSPLANLLHEPWAYVDDHLLSGQKMARVLDNLRAAGFSDVRGAVFCAPVSVQAHNGCSVGVYDDELTQSVHRLFPGRF